MRLFASIAAAVLLAVIALTACNSNEHPPKISQSAPSGTAPAPLPPGDSARRITTAELKAELARNNVLIVDVRGAAAYKQGHIKGAIQIPATEILAHIDQLPRDKTIATYCS